MDQEGPDASATSIRIEIATLYDLSPSWELSSHDGEKRQGSAPGRAHHISHFTCLRLFLAELPNYLVKM